MTRTISLREANQSFAKWVREVEAGEEFVITRNGTPVARLQPIVSRRNLTAPQMAALARTRHRMQFGCRSEVDDTFDRDALHER